MRLVRFRPQHLFTMEPQGPQKPHLEWMTPDIAELAAGHFSFTGIDRDGAIIGCAGLAPIEDDLVAWALFSPLLNAHALSVTRAVRNGLALHRDQRIIAHVSEEHIKAARFAEALDFKFSGRVAHPRGHDVLLYALER